ncbi:hypothetical protein BC832DRAFT_560731 [Gaertneriomyces semiglobifer]|nr:hypothetical protein BC832DRAFT_560731 [Gaertneriomyces semiglobifer]
MDDLLQCVVDEVALEGAEGCSLDRLWSLLEARQSRQDENADREGQEIDEVIRAVLSPVPTVKLDDPMKAFLWPQIVRLKSLSFVHITSPPSASDASTSRKQKQPAKKPAKARKSKQANAAEEDAVAPLPVIPKALLVPKSLSEVLGEYGSGLRIVANQDVRLLAVLGLHDPLMKLSDKVLTLLMHIAKERANGITQAELHKQLGLDPRSTFHYVKVLMEHGLIVKFSVVHDRSHTNLCIHKRFAEGNRAYNDYMRNVQAHQSESTTSQLGRDSPYRSTTDESTSGDTRSADMLIGDLIREKLTIMLSTAKNRTMLIHDLMMALKVKVHESRAQRKWFNGMVDALVRGGYIERINIPRRNDGSELRGSDRCVRLLKLYQPAQISSAMSVEAITKNAMRVKDSQFKGAASDPDRELVLGEGGMLSDLPVEYQVMRLVRMSGTRGCTARTIQRSLSGFATKPLNKILAKLIKTEEKGSSGKGLYRFAEFVGRERRYRYFASDVYEEMQKRGEQPGSMGGVAAVEEKVEEGVYVMDPNEMCRICHTADQPQALYQCQGCRLRLHSYCPDPADDSFPTEVDGVYLCRTCQDQSGNGDPLDLGQGTPASQVQPMDVDGPSERSLAVTPGPLPPPPPPTEDVAPTTQQTPIFVRPSVNLVQRRQFLLDIVEEKRIVDLGIGLTELYQDRLKRANIHSNHMIDRKTLMRTANSLAADGLIKVHTATVRTVTGATTTKTLFLHASLSTTGPEVKTYVTQLFSRNALYQEKRMPKVEVDRDLEVVRLQDIDPAVKLEVDNEIERRRRNKNTKDYWAVVAQQYGYINARMQRVQYLHEWLLRYLLKPQLQDNDFDDGDEASSGMEIGALSRSAGPYKNGGVFQGERLALDLDMDYIVKCVAINKVSPIIKAFIERPGALTTRFADLPRDVLKEIYDATRYTSRYRQSIKSLLETLEQLGIVKTLSKPVSKHEAGGTDDPSGRDALHVYQLIADVTLLDYVMPGRPPVKRFYIDRVEVKRQFWFQLEYLCCRLPIKMTGNRKGRRWGELESMLLDESNETNADSETGVSAETNAHARNENQSDRPAPQYILITDITKHPLGYLFNPKNWTNKFPYSAKQRILLERYVDRNTGATALNNEAVCRRVAEEGRLPIERVKAYFSRVEDMHRQKTVLKEEARRRRKALRSRVRQGYVRRRRRREGEDVAGSTAGIGHVDVSKIQSASQQVRAILSLGNSQSQAERMSRRQAGAVSKIAKGIVEVDNEMVAMIDADSEERFHTQYTTANQRVYTKWTPEDDTKLTHAFVIKVSTRDTNLRFQWKDVGELFRNAGFRMREGAKLSDICRRRWNILTRNLRHQSYVAGLSHLWPSIRNKGRQEGVIPDPEGSRQTGVVEDLTALVEYFMSQSGEVADEETEWAPLVHFPPTVAQLEAMYDISDKPVRRSVPQGELDEILGESHTTRHTMATLYSRAQTGLLSRDDADYPIVEFNTWELEEEIVKIVIKMILTTPPKVYDASHAYFVLGKYPLTLVDNAIKTLSKNQTIVKQKGGADRRVPGRGFALSDKFLTTLAGCLPDRLLPQAIAYANVLRDEVGEGMVFSPLASGGMMMVLVDAVVTDKILLEPRFENCGLDVKDPFDAHEDPVRTVNEVLCKPTHKLLETASKSGKRKADEEEGGKKRLRAEAAETGEDSHAGQTGKGQDTTSLAVPTHGSTPEGVILHTPILNEDDRSLIQQLYTLIDAAGMCGIPLPVLQERCASLHISAKELSRLLQLASTIRLSIPPIPIVTRVGFNDLRYVSSRNLGHWTIPLANPLSERTLLATSSSTRRETEVDFTPARVWYDINGHEVPAMKRACAEAVLGFLVKKPGISMSRLKRNLGVVMTTGELVEILDLLVKRGACRRRSQKKPSAVTGLADLFEKRVYEECDDDTACENQITYYWPMPEWFTKTVV